MTFKAIKDISYRFASRRNTGWESQVIKNGAAFTVPLHGMRGEYYLPTPCPKPSTRALAVYRTSVIKGTNDINIQFRESRFMVDLGISPTTNEPLKDFNNFIPPPNHGWFGFLPKFCCFLTS